MKPFAYLFCILAGCTQDHNLGETATSGGGGGSAGQGSEGSSAGSPPTADASASITASNTSLTAGDSSSTGGDDGGTDDGGSSGESGTLLEPCEPSVEMLVLDWPPASGPMLGLDADTIAALRGECTTAGSGLVLEPEADGLHRAFVDLNCELEGEVDGATAMPETAFALRLEVRTSLPSMFATIDGTIEFRMAAQRYGTLWDRWITLTYIDGRPGVDVLFDAVHAQHFDPWEAEQLVPLLESYGFGAWRPNLEYHLEEATCSVATADCVSEQFSVSASLELGEGGAQAVDMGGFGLLNWTDFGPFSKLYNHTSLAWGETCDGPPPVELRLVTMFDGPT